MGARAFAEGVLSHATLVRAWYVIDANVYSLCESNAMYCSSPIIQYESELTASMLTTHPKNTPSVAQWPSGQVAEQPFLG